MELKRTVAQRQRQWSQKPSSVSSNLTRPICQWRKYKRANRLFVSERACGFESLPGHYINIFDQRSDRLPRKLRIYMKSRNVVFHQLNGQLSQLLYRCGSSPPLVLVFKIIIYFGSVRERLKRAALKTAVSVINPGRGFESLHFL